MDTVDKKQLIRLLIQINKKLIRYNENDYYDDDYYKDCACYKGYRVREIIDDVKEIKDIVENLVESEDYEVQLDTEESSNDSY